MRDQRVTLAAAALGIVYVVTLTGCAIDRPVGAPTFAKSPSALDGSTAGPSSTNVVHYEPNLEGQVVRTSMDNVEGSAKVGVFDVTTDNVFVYLTCVGNGEIRINVDPLGSFPLDCATTGAASMNQFEVALYDTYGISIESGPGQVWAVTIAE